MGANVFMWYVQPLIPDNTVVFIKYHLIISSVLYNVLLKETVKVSSI